MTIPSSDRPRLLDLFCGAGGAAAGYQRAGFHVTGVDLFDQPNYCGDAFHQADAMAFPLDGFDVIHASPPCHDHSSITATKNGTGWMLRQTVDRLTDHGAPWVCENVVGPGVTMAGWWFVLCGSMFDMKVRRHRRFGSSHLMIPPAHRHAEQGRPYTISGNGNPPDVEYAHSLKPPSRDFWRYMDMAWMEGKPHYGVAQAIPPAYSHWIGTQLLQAMEVAA